MGEKTRETARRPPSSPRAARVMCDYFGLIAAKSNFPRYIGSETGGSLLLVSTGYGVVDIVGNPQTSPFLMSMTTLPSTCCNPSGLRSVVVLGSTKR